MNTEEKARAFDEALEKAKEWMDEREQMIYPREIVENIFPQLAESEDERVRKWIYNVIDSLGMPADEDAEKELEEMQPLALAYLEKQKEPHYTKRNALFDKCVENCDPEIMKKVSDEIDAKLQKEQKPAETSNIDLDTKINDWVGYMLNDNAQSYSRKNVQILLDNCARFFYDYAVMCLDKPTEWSEEDEKNMFIIRSALRDAKLEAKEEAECNGAEVNVKDFENAELWFKSLLEKFNLQPKQEWSEEDEIKLASLINYFEGDALDCSTEDILRWLKSLRPSWKPSEEQMRSLRDTIINTKGYSYSMYLPELYEQLKKLGVKEEPEYYQHFDPNC